MIKKNREKINQEVLDSIGSPNAWTPEAENKWIDELKKIPDGFIYCLFPPIRKPPNVGRRTKGFNWG